jgi:hypothetical protein
MPDTTTLASAIEQAINRDITSRRGWLDQWNGFDSAVRDDIRMAHRRIITEEIEAWQRAHPAASVIRLRA